MRKSIFRFCSRAICTINCFIGTAQFSDTAEFIKQNSIYLICCALLFWSASWQRVPVIVICFMLIEKLIFTERELKVFSFWGCFVRNVTLLPLSYTNIIFFTIMLLNEIVIWKRLLHDTSRTNWTFYLFHQKFFLWFRTFPSPRGLRL